MAGYALLNGANESTKRALLPGIVSGSTLPTLELESLNLTDHDARSIRETATFSPRGAATNEPTSQLLPTASRRASPPTA